MGSALVTEDVVRRVQGRLGEVLSGKWRLNRLLGVGGVAAVYEATHRNQNRVAIKLLHPEQIGNEVVASRFVHEGYVANSVGHPGAVKVIDDDVDAEGAPFLVMELLEGETLDERLWRHGSKLPGGEVLALADQVLDVLASAHDKRIVHRDIKPDNLFLTREGRVKVLDFGIARLAEVWQGSPGTLAGTLMGTPSFMAPEQARSRWDEVDARSDIFSMGATMFTLLTGVHVHDAETVTEQLALAVTTPAPKLREVEPTAAPVLAALIDRALEYEKAQRWPSARAMQAAVRDAMTTLPPPRTFSVSPAEAGRRTPKPRSKGSIQGADTMVAPVLYSRAREGAADAVSVTRVKSIFLRPRLAFGAVLVLLIAGFVVVSWARKQEPTAELQAQLQPASALPPSSAPPPSEEQPATSRPSVDPTPVASASTRALRTLPRPGSAAIKSRPEKAATPPTSDDPFAKRY